MGYRVLIVDDEEKVRRVIKLHLSKEGFEVIEAFDGEQGILKLNEDDNSLMVDAIISDIRMPKMGGKDAIKYFREQFPLTPVIVLTGFPDTALAVDLMKKGVVEYLVKPVSKEKLITAVFKAIEKKVGSPEARKVIYP